MPSTATQRRAARVAEVKSLYGWPVEKLREFATKQLAEIERGFAEINDSVGSFFRRFEAIKRTIAEAKASYQRGEELATSNQPDDLLARKRAYVMTILNARTAADEIDTEKILGHSLLLAFEYSPEVLGELKDKMVDTVKGAGEVAKDAAKAAGDVAGETARSLAVPLAIGGGVVVAGVVAAVALSGKSR